MANMMTVLAALYSVMHGAEMFFNQQEREDFTKAGLKFLKLYSWLHDDAGKRNKKLFNVVPKFHYMFHLLQQGVY